MTDRRRFLSQLLAAGGLAAAGTTALWPDEPSSLATGSAPSLVPPGDFMWPAGRAIVEATMDRILPSWPGSPGAAEVGAIAFLESAIRDGFVESDQAQALSRGAMQLEQRVQTQLGHSFLVASIDERDRALGSWQLHSLGESWMRALVIVTLEAFFSDPIYGANPGGISWAWAGIKPPYPRPANAS